MQTLIEQLKAAITAESYEDRAGRSVISVKSALDIVDRLAAEQPEEDRRWILCSERMPSSEEYQKCNGQFIVTDGNRTYATYFDIYDTLKFGEPTMTGFKIDRCVTAWQPLPEKPEQEEQHEAS